MFRFSKAKISFDTNFRLLKSLSKKITKINIQFDLSLSYP